MLRRDRHRGAAHQVIEPEVFRRLPREESFQPALANHFGNKLPRPIKQREKTVPIHREQKRLASGATRLPLDGNAASRSVSFRRSNRSTASTAGNSGTNTRSSFRQPQTHSENPPPAAVRIGLRSASTPALTRESSSAPRMPQSRKVVADRSNRSQQRLVQSLRRCSGPVCAPLRPMAFCPARKNLLIARVALRRLPRKLLRHAHKRMKNHKRRFETAAVRLQQRRLIRGINELFVLHPTG